jgi:multidrug efflux system membrane fusion protein
MASGKEGVLQFIDNSVDATTGTIKIKAAFENADRVLWPGEFVNVQIRLSLERGRLLVPSRSIQTGPQGKYVWILNPDQTVVMRPVDVVRIYKPNASHAGRESALIKGNLRCSSLISSFAVPSQPRC